jgi:dihydroorotate dehydrogenase
MAERRAALARQHATRSTQGKTQLRRVPMFVKIAPDLDADQVAVIAATLQRHDAADALADGLGWGVIATNTTTSRDAVQGLQHAEETGGLSGAPVLAASNRVIAQLRAALGKGFPIIGVGGVLSARDALTKIDAGADLVQIYTGLIYKGPALVGQAATALRDRRA